MSKLSEVKAIPGTPEGGAQENGPDLDKDDVDIDLDRKTLAVSLKEQVVKQRKAVLDYIIKKIIKHMNQCAQKGVSLTSIVFYSHAPYKWDPIVGWPDYCLNGTSVHKSHGMSDNEVAATVYRDDTYMDEVCGELNALGFITQCIKDEYSFRPKYKRLTCSIAIKDPQKTIQEPLHTSQDLPVNGLASFLIFIALIIFMFGVLVGLCGYGNK
jgi:hypothetical protein